MTPLKLYRVTRAETGILVEARTPFDAEKAARQIEELRDQPLSVVADSQIWQRQPPERWAK